MSENEQATAYEWLYSVDDLYIYVQKCDEGFDYTLYSKQTYKEIDGGQLDIDTELITEAVKEICCLHDLATTAPLRLEDADLLDDIQETQRFKS